MAGISILLLLLLISIFLLILIVIMNKIAIMSVSIKEITKLIIFTIMPAVFVVCLFALILIIKPIIDMIKLMGLKIMRKLPTKEIIPRTIDVVFRLLLGSLISLFGLSIVIPQFGQDFSVVVILVPQL